MAGAAPPIPKQLPPNGLVALALFDQGAVAVKKGESDPDIRGFGSAYAIAISLFEQAAGLVEDLPPDSRLDCVMLAFAATLLAAENAREARAMISEAIGDRDTQLRQQSARSFGDL